MQQVNDFRENGEKATQPLLVRLTINQKERLKKLTEASGYKNVSDYVRVTLLNPSIEMKLNNIIEILQEKNKLEKK